MGMWTKGPGQPLHGTHVNMSLGLNDFIESFLLYFSLKLLVKGVFLKIQSKNMLSPSFHF